jgi:hypothetical protein
MTDEPIYNYVPGKGWVVACNNNEILEIVCMRGNRYRLINRKPVTGENYLFKRHDYKDYFLADGITPKLSAWDGKSLIIKFKDRFHAFSYGGYVTLEKL